MPFWRNDIKEKTGHNQYLSVKHGTRYVLLNRLHAVGPNKTPGQGFAPTPLIGARRHDWIIELEKMSKSEKRQRSDVLLGIRCYPEEKEQIKAKADAAGLSVGEFLRRCALGRKIQAKCDTKLIMELSRLGGLQKHLFNEGRGNVSDKFSKEYSQVLVAIQKAILTIGREGQ
ncbi:conjugal transfer relaxosome component TraJ [Yersinia pekkanenii]|uniref:Conjugal transfer relaxosome component TraJ n=2 Tax=Yersinia TaxID=629 RepID=A0A0T9RHH5_9GAMM|nr:conjugal transfer relaxosome component TraJ [Yersinia pekkanenii]CRY69245.1 conjugal transfer relaxosome component TraJ [Yersinia pekkanenii]